MQCFSVSRVKVFMEFCGSGLRVKDFREIWGLSVKDKRVEMGTPNREPQEYSRNIIGICLPGS